MTTTTTIETPAKLALATVNATRTLNSELASQSVEFAFRGHYANACKGIYGIQSLVISILVKHGSVNTNGAENSELRPVAVACSMFKAEVESEVRKAFGVNRYPAATLRVVLGNSKFKSGQGPDNGIRQIQLTKAEDNTGCKPRAKYYLDNSPVK